MLKLSRKIEYSLMALKHLSLKEGEALTSAKDLSQKYNVPFDVVSRVLQILNQKEIVKSVQGINGGYKLIKPLSALTFYELVEFIEGPLFLVKCLQGECDMVGTCNIIAPVQVLNDKLSQFLKTILVSDLVLAQDFQPTLSLVDASANSAESRQDL